MSNKTLKVDAEKTKSAPNVVLHFITLVPVLFILTLLICLLLIVFSKNEVVVAPSAGDSSVCLRTVSGSSDCQFYLQTANTDVTRARGLSGRTLMAKNEGMIFEFNNEVNQCFWMKDMNFSLDIIWLNSAKEITQINSNVSPGTYPDQFCAEAQFVIELNSGMANSLAIGQRMAF